MPFKPGKPKTGGRKKGSKNLITPMKPLRISLAELNFNLAEELLKALAAAKDDHSRLRVLELITKYTQVAPKEEVPLPPTNPQPDDDDQSDEELLQALNVHPIK